MNCSLSAGEWYSTALTYDKMDKLLSVDGKEEFSINAASVGKIY
ncbi:MAG: hypothetical protein ACE5HY_06235 [Candidatus Hydrothermarchaeales archaeon]